MNFKNSEDQKNYIWKFQKIFDPGFRPGSFYYRNLLNKYLEPNYIVLDAGSGHKGFIYEFKDKVKRLVALDIDPAQLNLNTKADEKILSSLNKIPLADNSIDFINCEFVMEHIKEPDLVILEMSRVMKSGSK